jgi:hypothetical protein
MAIADDGVPADLKADRRPRPLAHEGDARTTVDPGPVQVEVVNEDLSRMTKVLFP